MSNGYAGVGRTKRTLRVCRFSSRTPMMTNKIEITAAGKTFRVPSAEICGRQVVVTGNWLRKAAIKDEDLVEGQLVEDPQHFLREMKKNSLRADILTFAQKIPDCVPRNRYHFEWDNWAV